MATSLKTANQPAIVSVLFGNLVLFYLAVSTDSLLVKEWVELARKGPEIVPAGLILILAGVLNALIPPAFKARIVFLRWNDALPGCRAFSIYAWSDPRVDRPSLERAHGVLPTDPGEQNRLWYRIFKSVENDPGIEAAHKAFLFTRDYTSLAIMLFISLGILGYIFIPSNNTAFIFQLVLGAQVLLALQAARVNGAKLVCNVLAKNSTSY